MDLQLAGRRCLITGASSGIGDGVARLLAAEGVRLAIAGRNKDTLDTLRAELIGLGSPDVIVCAGDVSTADGAIDVAQSAMRGLGHVDMLVNNAGGSRPMQPVEHASPADEDAIWEESFALNFNAARRISAVLTPHMVSQRWGRVVNITGAVLAATMNAATPAKAALQSWSKSLAGQLAPAGVTVNCVAPGRINSRQIREVLHPTDASRDAYIKANIPIGYFGEPEDLACSVAFLLSPLSRYITGITIHVDGGLHRLAP